MIAEGQIWKLGPLDFVRVQRIDESGEVTARTVTGAASESERRFAQGELESLGTLIGENGERSAHFADGRSRKAGQ